ncbi:AAA family ATPase [Marivirga salinae]|uniref:AAA family ATPase n=1 Tax=Marivirga salinarum TaxID=3059078 RepID=A0AA51NDZ3_9BACT|nr:AAA family ATPase [Marivirga sp. BDSF4-3]WMN12100.1 AAA family ATPase [Marivirga sp. BDSF4-3]
MDWIEIQGYKSIKDIRLEVNPINILIGSNGSGKSNFISFFEFLNALQDRQLKEYIALRGGAEKMLHKGSENTHSINFSTSFGKGINGYKATLQLGEEHFIFDTEYLIYKGNEGRNIANFGTEARIKATDNYRAKYVIKHLNSYRKYHFHDTSKNSPFSQMSHVDNDQFYLYEEGSNLSAFLYFIQNNYQIVYNRIIQTIQSIAPYFSDFFFQPNKEGYTRLQWKSKYGSTIYGASDLSDGTIRFIALTTLFMQPNLPSSIIIDEPELGLHPFAISKLAGMIKSVAAKEVQVILATQSADLVNHFEPEDIITVDQVEGESQFNRLKEEDLKQWLDTYNVGDLWQRNILLGGQPNK